jgi:serine phosphatase RsbU (regulator of sigma subunit)
MVGAEKDGAVSNREPQRTELKPIEGLDLQARYNAARVGGDFYDAVAVGTRVAFLLCDIAGRRPETHPIAAEAQQTFREKAQELFGAVDANLMDGTALLVQAINGTLVRAAGGIRFAPTFVGCYDVQLGLMAYINAGGQTAVIRDSDDTRMLPNVHMPMGLFTHLTYEPSMMAFDRGAALVVVTKGVTESMQGGIPFGAEGVLSLMGGTAQDSAGGICEAVLEAALGFEKVSWLGEFARRFSKDKVVEDVTAVAVVRQKEEAVPQEL